VLQRLFERAVSPDSFRHYFRHQVYRHIADKAPEVWNLCGTREQRAAALKDPKEVSGSRPAPAIVRAWDTALKSAFNGLEFNHIKGSRQMDKPNGVWTTELGNLPDEVRG